MALILTRILDPWASGSGSKSQFCHLLVWHVQGPHHQPASLKLKILQQDEGIRKRTMWAIENRRERGLLSTRCRGHWSRVYSAIPQTVVTTPSATAYLSNPRKLLENVLQQNDGANQKRRCKILAIGNVNHRRAKGIPRIRAEAGPRITQPQAWEQATPDKTEQRCPGAKFPRNLLELIDCLMRVTLRKIILRGYR